MTEDEDDLINLPEEEDDEGEDLTSYTFKNSYRPMPIRWLLMDFVEGKIKTPTYQRSDTVWSKSMKIKLITSVIRGIPIPPIYFFQEGNTLEIVDGLQRMTALKNFFRDKTIKVEIKLKDNPEMKEYSWEDLQKVEDYQNLDEKELAVIRIEQEAPSNDTCGKFDIFYRLNRNSVSLTEQEVRRAIYNSDFSDLLSRLNNNKIWREIWDSRRKTKNKKNNSKDVKDLLRGKDEEILLRAIYMAYYRMDEKLSLTKGISHLMNLYEKQQLKLNSELATRIETESEKVFQFIKDTTCVKQLTINKAASDAIVAVLLKNADKLGDLKQVIHEREDTLMKNDNFIASTKDATSGFKKVKTRYNIANRILMNVEFDIC
jgi:hypothetical protein